MKTSLYLSMALTAVLILSTTAAAQIQFTSAGSYVERDGTTHAWSVTPHRTLLWDGVPYVPAGVIFYSRYVSIDQTEENWQADVRSLEALRAKGITDLLLTPGAPISWTDPSAWQRLLDHLDNNDFTYGINLFDGPTGNVSGFIVRPNRYRMPNITTDGDYSFSAEDVESGIFVLSSSRDGSVVRVGGLRVQDGRMSASVKTGRGANYVLLAYPEVDLSGVEDGLPDVWTGFDDYRDRLLRFFSSVSTGKGLRFILNPMSGSFGPTGQFENLIPSSPAFRMEFEAWLARKYPAIGNLCAAWGIIAQDVRSFEEAARLLPLWYGGKGTPTAYDRANGKTHTMDVTGSAMWQDILDFRDASIHQYMNSAADILKREVADVPVLYRARSFHRVYASSRQHGGFDGLAAATKGVGEQLAEREAAWARGLAEESNRSMWLLVSSVKPPEESYPSRAAMHVDLDYLKELGMKGVYISGVQTPPEARDGSDLLRAPEQLDWLKEFGSALAAASDFQPRIVKFPARGDVGAKVRRLGEGMWWLPTLQTGEAVGLGGGAIGYTIKGDDALHVWNSDGTSSTVTLPLREGQQPRVLFPLDAGSRLTISSDGLKVQLSGSPIVISGLEREQSVPIETVEEEIRELERAAAAVQKTGKKSPTTKQALERARTVLKNRRTLTAYEIVRSELANLAEQTGAYIWLEAEYPNEQNMDGVAAATGASNGRYLALDSNEEAPMSPYSATYYFQVPREGKYDIYASGSSPGDGSSVTSFSIDGGSWQVPETGMLGAAYGPSFGWYKLTSTTLSKGRHSLTFNVIGRRRSDNAYFFALDAILITPWPFSPEGAKRPPSQFGG